MAPTIITIFSSEPPSATPNMDVNFSPSISRLSRARAAATDSPSTIPPLCGQILDEALAVCAPTLIEAVVDPYEPPMPPNITIEQAAHFAESLAKGEPSRKKIALTVLEDKVREMV